MSTFDWIPINIRKPENTGDYLVTQIVDGIKGISVVHYSVVYDEWYNGGFEVVAWISLPDPYEETIEDEEMSDV